MSQTPTTKASESPQHPDLLIDDADFPGAARELAKRFAADGRLLCRGRAPVKVIQIGGRPVVQNLGHVAIVSEAHQICRPVIKKLQRGVVSLQPKTLPIAVAKLFAEIPAEWNFRALKGMCFGPILRASGEIRLEAGYDEETGLWCAGTAPVGVPESPSDEEAKGALALLRFVFATFPFADRRTDAEGLRVDVALPPGGDESAFLVAVLTALCRPSLPLAPAILIRAPALSGAGTGKGLLIRALANIATGESPRAFTSGADRAELDKRLAASLVEAEALIFLDNVNGTTLRSDLLAQVITENPCSMRLLGRTQMVQLETRAVICVTGNAIDVSEDLARRFIIVGLDAKLENPELRRFDGRFLDTIRERRSELMSAALTIWRWGRKKELPRGLPLGSFEAWARWVRDPLLALGCVDPVTRIEEIKRDDPERRQAVEFLMAWRAEYGDRPVTVAEMHDDLRGLVGARGATRQAMAQYVNRLLNTRIAAFHLIRQTHGKWGASRYILQADEGALSGRGSLAATTRSAMIEKA